MIAAVTDDELSFIIGNILIDNRDIRSISLESLRMHVGLVTQDTVSTKINHSCSNLRVLPDNYFIKLLIQNNGLSLNLKFILKI